MRCALAKWSISKTGVLAANHGLNVGARAPSLTLGASPGGMVSTFAAAIWRRDVEY